MFSRRWLLNGFLLLAIVLIVWLGGFFETPREAPPALTVAGFDATRIDRIEIRSAESSLVLIRREDRWSIADPLEWPASQSAVERLFAIPVIGDARPLDSDGLDPVTLGIDGSGIEILLGDTLIRFGIGNNIGDRRYTMIGEHLYLLPDLYAPLVAQGLPGFVDRRLLPPGFDLTRREWPGALISRGVQGWESPALAAQLATDLATGWQELEASRVADFNEPASDAATIVAGFEGAPDFEFLLLSSRPEIVIANPALGFRYHFPSALRDRLLPPGDG